MSPVRPPREFEDFLRRTGLVESVEVPLFTPLEGGVSSDIWKVDVADRAICVKRALAKLKVEGDWHAPVERNAFEVAWMQKAASIAPGSAPEILAHDPASGMFAMTYLDPADCKLWKSELRAGRADPDFASRCGHVLGTIHCETAGDAEVAARFATDEIFHAIRLEPYLEATAACHADVAGRLHELSAITAANRIVLVHGDVSPKNILVTADGPVFLDAECAWFGDPAFDLAFCLNHFLLKCLWTPAAAEGFLTCFDAMASAYVETAGAALEAVECRTAHLLPGLFLARVDGKSPVEYLSDAADIERVRRVSKALLNEPVDTLDGARGAWQRELNSGI